MDGHGPRIAINGFGRIGRLVTRILLAGEQPVDLVGINDLMPKDTMSHLFRYDSVHGRFEGTVSETADGLALGGDNFKVFHEPDPSRGLWKETEPDLVIEASGRYTKSAELQKHLDGGAPHVLVTAPAEADLMVVRGINDSTFDPALHRTVSNASCTTNCLALVAKVLDDAWGIESGLMTTIHAATNDQRVADSPHSDLRRARGSLTSLIPTTTGAASAIGQVLPKLAGKLDGQAVRVPTTDVSLVDLVAQLGSEVSPGTLIDAFEAAASGPMAGLLGVEHAPLVSVDYLGDMRSAIIDAGSLQSRGNLVKIMAWYDNEWGYATRVAEMAHLMTA